MSEFGGGAISSSAAAFGVGHSFKELWSDTGHPSAASTDICAARDKIIFVKKEKR